MLLNNLEPEVAERPDDLIVYGGRVKQPATLKALDNIYQSIKSAGE
jgi:urocanate hydratase